MIASKRIMRGLTQRDVYETIGLSKSAYHSYEKGRRDIPMTALVAICRVVQVEPARLVQEAAETWPEAFTREAAIAARQSRG